MKRSSSTTANQRKEILAELNDITTMERGTLAEEYRERPALGGQGNRITGGRTPFEPARIGNPEQCRARKERFLRRQAEHLGFTMTPVEQEIS